MILRKKKRNSFKLIINSIEIEETKKAVLLGIKIDNLFNFQCRTANYKLYALRRFIFRKSENFM